MTFLTIFTRHLASRERQFARMLASVQGQTCQDVEHVVAVDDEGRGWEWANRQFAAHQDEVHGDYVLILDDDDLLAAPDAVELLRQTAAETGADVVVFRVDHLHLGILPDKAVWGKRPQPAHIGGSAVIVRRALWKRALPGWDSGRYEADYDFLERVWSYSPSVAWLDRLIVRCQRVGHGIAEGEAKRLTLEDLQATACRRLNVGCGDAPIPYWTNLDMDAGVRADVHEDALAYLRRQEAGTFDEIWACHFIEHLPHEGAYEFVQECYRVLTPGGKLGVVVPDTREIMRRYLAGSKDGIEFPHRVWWMVSDLDAVCTMWLYSTYRGTPHQWSYDMATLRRLVESGGFQFVQEVDRFADPRIGQGAWYQCGADWVKPCA